MIEVASASPAAADLHLEIQSSQGNSSAYKKPLAMNSEFNASHFGQTNGRLTDFLRDTRLGMCGEQHFVGSNFTSGTFVVSLGHF